MTDYAAVNLAAAGIHVFPARTSRAERTTSGHSPIMGSTTQPRTLR
jgi:hypothetical protein